MPVQFATRLVMGALCGAAIGAVADVLLAGMACGVVGAVLGTYIGATVRDALARAFGRDLPASLIEDLIAVRTHVSLVYGAEPPAARELAHSLRVGRETLV